VDAAWATDDRRKEREKRESERGTMDTVRACICVRESERRNKGKNELNRTRRRAVNGAVYSSEREGVLLLLLLRTSAASAGWLIRSGRGRCDRVCAEPSTDRGGQSSEGSRFASRLESVRERVVLQGAWKGQGSNMNAHNPNTHVQHTKCHSIPNELRSIVSSWIVWRRRVQK
jgi:hypothetical protein